MPAPNIVAIDGVTVENRPVSDISITWAVNAPVTCSIKLPVGKKMLPFASGEVSEELPSSNAVTVTFKKNTIFTGYVDTQGISVNPYMDGASMAATFDVALLSPIAKADQFAGGKLYIGVQENVQGDDPNATSADSKALMMNFNWEELLGAKPSESGAALNTTKYILHVKENLEKIHKSADASMKMSTYVDPADFTINRDSVDVPQFVCNCDTYVTENVANLASMPALQAMDMMQSWFFLTRVPKTIDGSKYTFKPDFPMYKKESYTFDQSEIFGVSYNKRSAVLAPKWVIVNMIGLTISAQDKNDTGTALKGGINFDEYAFWPQKNKPPNMEIGIAEVYDMPGPFRFGSFKDDKADPATGSKSSQGGAPYKEGYFPTSAQAAVAAVSTSSYKKTPKDLAELIAKMEYGRRAFGYASMTIMVRPEKYATFVPLLGEVVKFPTPKLSSKQAALGPMSYGCLSSVSLQAGADGKLNCTLVLTSVRTESENTAWGMDVNPMYNMPTK